MSGDRCKDCGRRHDRPAHPYCKGGSHVDPDTAQKIVAALEADLTDRRGLSGEWDAIDDGVKDDIRDEWADLIRKTMS